MSAKKTSDDPRSNKMHERTDSLISDMLHTQELHVPCDKTIKDEMWTLLQSAACSLWATSNAIIKWSSGQIIFGQEMIIHKVILIDWNLIKERNYKR